MKNTHKHDVMLAIVFILVVVGMYFYITKNLLTNSRASNPMSTSYSWQYTNNGCASKCGGRTPQEALSKYSSLYQADLSTTCVSCIINSTNKAIQEQQSLNLKPTVRPQKEDKKSYRERNPGRMNNP